MPVLDTPQILHAKAVRVLASEVRTVQQKINCTVYIYSIPLGKTYEYEFLTVFILHQSKYKEASKKEMQSGSFTTLSDTRDTAHSRTVNKLVSGV